MGPLLTYRFIVCGVKGSPSYLCFLFGCLGNVWLEVHLHVWICTVTPLPRNLGNGCMEVWGYGGMGVCVLIPGL